MNILELTVYIFTALIIALLLFFVVTLSISNKRIHARSVQAEMDRILTMVQLEKIVAEKNAAAVEKTDGFMKFVSDSRDWAFTYIEDVQQAIKDYDEALSKSDPNLMNAAYKKLVDMLPDDAL